MPTEIAIITLCLLSFASGNLAMYIYLKYNCFRRIPQSSNERNTAFLSDQNNRNLISPITSNESHNITYTVPQQSSWSRQDPNAFGS